jgi:hypothetical protein
MATRTFSILKTSGDPGVERTVEVSAGAASASKIPNLNAVGVLDLTVVNATQASAGAGDAAKLVALDSAGRMSSTMLPVGVGADSKTLTTSEVIAAGAWVNINAGLVRNADASNGREAMAFSLLGAGNGASCVIYFEGANTAVSGKTPGAVQFLSATTPGASTETAPVAVGQYVQRLGFATSATEVNAQIMPPIGPLV